MHNTPYNTILYISACAAELSAFDSRRIWPNSERNSLRWVFRTRGYRQSPGKFAQRGTIGGKLAGNCRVIIGASPRTRSPQTLCKYFAFVCLTGLSYPRPPVFPSLYPVQSCKARGVFAPLTRRWVFGPLRLNYGTFARAHTPLKS